MNPPRQARQRGFVFLLVMMLLAVASILIGVSLQRAATQSAIANAQIDGYRRHHEMLGIRDYCRFWLRDRELDAKKLSEYARTGEVAHRLVLENNTVVLISVKDGQGTMLRALGDITQPDTRRWIVEVLARMPLERADLTRRSGPPQVSLHAAPDEVLDAIAAYEPKASSALREARDRRIPNATELQMALERRGIEGPIAGAIIPNFTFEPALWRLNVEVVYPDHVNRYTLLAEKSLNLQELHEWRPVSDAEAEQIFGRQLAAPNRGETGL